MKIPKVQRKYCPKCKNYTEQKVKRVKNKPRRTLAIGQRRYLRKMVGYGGFPKKEP